MSALLDAIRKPSVTNQPPTSREIMRSDLATVALIIAALLLGLAVRNTTLSASKKVELEGMPPLAIPAHWMPGTADNLDFYARSAGSPSIFDTEMAVYTRRLRNEETLISARTAWGVRRSQDLERYRELSAEPVTVLDGQPCARHLCLCRRPDPPCRGRFAARRRARSGPALYLRGPTRRRIGCGGRHRMGLGPKGD